MGIKVCSYTAVFNKGICVEQVVLQFACEKNTKTMRINSSFAVINVSVKISQKQIKAVTVEIHHPTEAHYGSQPSRDDRVDAESVTQ